MFQEFLAHRQQQEEAKTNIKRDFDNVVMLLLVMITIKWITGAFNK